MYLLILRAVLGEKNYIRQEACSGRGEARKTSRQRRMLERSAVSLGWGSGHAAPKLHSHSTHLKMHVENFGTENLPQLEGY